MGILSVPVPNLFSSLPQNSPPLSSSSSFPPPPPIPVPKYPPPRLRSQNPKPPQTPSSLRTTTSSHADAASHTNAKSAFRATHRRSKYYKPVHDSGVISSDGDRSVLVGESGLSYLLPGAPFEFQYSYSETPKTKPLAIREPAFLPFAPPTMPRPWTGKAPLKSKKDRSLHRLIPLFSSEEEVEENDASADESGAVRCRHLEMASSSIEFGKYNTKPGKDVLGEPLRKWEIKMLMNPYLSRPSNKQVNLGRDGLTHNMLELIHSHWRRQEVCKVRCLGVPTVDMNNVCWHLEKKTGGKIIYRIGGIVYLFRGRNYDYRTRPKLPIMLWKPAAPMYPKLIQEAPEGLTKIAADEMRMKGKRLLPICRLAKNGVYASLVKDVRHAFEGSPLVKIDCRGMHATDYKKLGAKLKDLVPCVLLSFDDEQILMWRGSSWKSMYPKNAATVTDMKNNSDPDVTGDKEDFTSSKPSPKMMLLWKQAIESNRAVLLEEVTLDPDELLLKVEQFEGIRQTYEHSYPARSLVNQSVHLDFGGDLNDGHSCEEELEQEDLAEEDDEYESDKVELSVPYGSLPIDHLAERLNWKH